MSIADSILSIAEYAASRYGDFSSAHEAFGVLSEEVAELFEAIRRNDLAAIRLESIDVAAVAMRLAEATTNDAFRKRSGPSRV